MRVQLFRIAAIGHGQDRWSRSVTAVEFTISEPIVNSHWANRDCSLSPAFQRYCRAAQNAVVRALFLYGARARRLSGDVADQSQLPAPKIYVFYCSLAVADIHSRLSFDQKAVRSTHCCCVDHPCIEHRFNSF